ncbi:N-acetylglucosaminyl-phosphatidylinositol de-N-acetylase isoform X2 [Conger conger]|uniref:N-acetylglucosaminyl-phosphatidylinositol de-N-acetylase isoform X2 n=1 Tax=Conger conger TaxID=82655 RepID=UPI002A59F0FF|nr:N-acetylglucosaminyl-phosphatidylinositol de-N-acetylase isoform X2 [Conger conger]
MLFSILVSCSFVCFYFILLKIIYYRHSRTSWNKHLFELYRRKAGRSRTCENTARNEMCPWQSGHNNSLNEIRALLVTAHPDDECMFFAPTILRLLQLNASVNLLCLSSGNYYNQGVHRQRELRDSCAVLGIPASQVTIIDCKELPDDPKKEWNIHVISSLILKQVKASSINLVLTFDGRGVSGHANHIAIYRSLRYLASTGEIPDGVSPYPTGCCVLSLQTVNVIRKYLSVLELPITWLCRSDVSFLIGSEEYKQAKRAMFCHRSQLLWFRHLYLLLSRYMFTNTFQVISQEEKDWKIY